MKKIILFMMLVVCAISAAAAPNPWVEATPEQILQETGLSIACPASAQDVTYRLLQNESLAEMQFAWCGSEYVLRVCPAAGFEIEDISGMYYDWTEETPDTVRGRDALVRRTTDGDQHVESCLWIDIAPGLMYSLSAVSAEKTDIRATAEMLFVPVQGETDDIGNVTALEIVDVLERCIGYEGTAGESLKKVIIAGEVCRFVIGRNIGSQDSEVLTKEAQIAWMALPEVYRAEAKAGFNGVAWLIDGALCDLEGHMGLFEDAGMAEEMPRLLQDPQFLAGWQAFYWGLQNETDM